MSLVDYRFDRAIATITLNSPANRNALSAQVVHELSTHLKRARADPEVRALVLTHAGSTFCAGADLKEQASEGGPQAGSERLLALLRQLVEIPKPVVARIDGHVRAGGIGIVGACDIVIVSSKATFAFTEVRLGVAAALISMTTLTRMSERDAARYLLTGDLFDASVAATSGLITAATDDLEREITAIADSLRHASPQALAATKSLITRPVLRRLDADGEDMQRLSARLFASEEAQEGIASFREKRPARWVC
ncbi:enoyl-CoA hydratase family protein [Cryptosporangium aurantiacum]|uniref:Enoyl-CoA hydratase n=1 Tax=Cryptosporangium aurantiacum TaxID=134849 RepID=A0A1M7R3M9_9ACTN|nr:enoyl-CoA hydratase family protein [Cryptosporangium aurantiacum]SHN39621.1 enoyl-CoA hydratase [Cryptosporangium aurantiacum]